MVLDQWELLPLLRATNWKSVSFGKKVSDEQKKFRNLSMEVVVTRYIGKIFLVLNRPDLTMVGLYRGGRCGTPETDLCTAHRRDSHPRQPITAPSIVMGSVISA